MSGECEIGQLEEGNNYGLIGLMIGRLEIISSRKIFDDVNNNLIFKEAFHFDDNTTKENSCE